MGRRGGNETLFSSIRLSAAIRIGDDEDSDATDATIRRGKLAGSWARGGAGAQIFGWA